MYNEEDELFGEPVQQQDNQNNEQETQQQDNHDFLQQYHYNSEEDENDIFGQQSAEKGNDKNDENSQEEEDFISKYLRTKKIDKSKIRILNQDTQEEEEVNFDTLSDDEKIALLEMVNQPMLSDSEIDAINFMRQHKLDLNTYAESIKQQVLKELGGKQQSSEVSKISDDDLFRFDLIDRYGFDQEKDADEIEAILEKEKENESLYNRKITALRKEYEQLEENQRLSEQQEAEAAQQQEWEDLKNNLIQVAQGTELLHGLELDNHDKNEVLSFILDRDDVTGESEFIKCYKNPEMLFKMAWYALKGDEAFRTIDDYYKGKLTEARRENKQSQQQNQTVNRKQLLGK